MAPTPALADAKSANIDAVMTALRLVGHSSTPPVAVTAGPSTRPAVLPTARFRTAMDELAGHGTYTALDASRPNLKALLTDVLNWAGKPKATKPVVKVIGAAMSGTNEHGTSCYPQALEMLSFLALCAPLVEPDRLARIAALAHSTPNAYKPMRYPVTPASQLQRLLGRYGEARREALLASLWLTAHDGRWWDAIGGPRRRGRRPAAADLPAEQEHAIQEQLERILRGQRAPTAETVVSAFASQLLPYSEPAAQALARLRVRTDDERRLLAARVNDGDADVPVLLSFVGGLLPDDRAESPIVGLIDALHRDLGDDLEDPGALPEKPEDWASLFPAASRDGFPMPNQVRALSKASIPSLPGAKVTMLRHAEDLRRNADHMGNCTFSYLRRSEEGSTFIGHLAYLAGEYNFAMHSLDRGAAGTGWRLGEVNSRFNRRDVPPEVRAGLTRLIAELNAR